jgi:hypothetical protein
MSKCRGIALRNNFQLDSVYQAQARCVDTITFVFSHLRVFDFLPLSVTKQLSLSCLTIPSILVKIVIPIYFGLMVSNGDKLSDKEFQ